MAFSPEGRTHTRPRDTANLSVVQSASKSPLERRSTQHCRTLLGEVDGVFAARRARIVCGSEYRYSVHSCVINRGGWGYGDQGDLACRESELAALRRRLWAAGAWLSLLPRSRKGRTSSAVFEVAAQEDLRALSAEPIWKRGITTNCCSARHLSSFSFPESDRNKPPALHQQAAQNCSAVVGQHRSTDRD